MTGFGGVAKDLSDAVAYEVDAINYLRATWGQENNISPGQATVTLGETTPEGALKVALGATFTISVSEGAVRAALDRLRPLAFSAAFKIQDMVAEWILRANGVTDWPFSKKLAAYDNLRGNGTLIEPPYFVARPSVARAFWELYRFLVPFRGTVVHSGGVILERDGTVVIRKGQQLLRLSSPEQTSYMRAAGLTAKLLANPNTTDPFIKDLVESALHELSAYHGQTGLTVRQARIASLTVQVPVTQLVDTNPVATRIDFDALRGRMEQIYALGPGGLLHLSISIVVQGDPRNPRWEIPFEAVPAGTVVVREGDAQYDQFLRLAP